MTALAERLAGQFGLTGVHVEPHDGGMNSRTWWVTSDAGHHVAKWVPLAAAQLFEAGLEAADLAASGGLVTGRAWRIDGRATTTWDDGALALLDRVPGQELDGDAGDAQQVVGATLARAHRATVGRTVAGSLGWHWVEPHAPYLVDDVDLRSAVEAAVRAVAALGGLVTGVCHGDPAPEAFLIGATDPALIDWGSPVSGPLLYDVASAAMYLGGTAAAAPMVSAYVAAGGLAVPDLPHLTTMLRFRWAVQADYFAERVAAADLTGVASAADNHAGLDAARRQLRTLIPRPHR